MTRDRSDMSLGRSLAESDNVAWILASDWLRVTEVTCVWAAVLRVFMLTEDI